MLFSAPTLITLALGAAGVVAESPNRAVHKSIAQRARGDVDISKRAYTGSKWSFYDVGLGACGKVNVNSDFIVALNQQQFGTSYPSPFCGKTITLNYKGKTATATIMDSCPGCPYGGLDLSRGLFKHFASEDTGIIYGEWSMAGEKPAAAAAPAPVTTTSPKPKPAPTTTKVTTTWTPPATTEQARIATTTKKPAPAPTTTKKPAPEPTTTKKPAPAPTTTWTPPKAAATTSSSRSSSSSSSSKKTPTTSSATPSSSGAALKQAYASASSSSASIASIASSYASAMPTASLAANSTGNATITEIQNNLDALGAILARLSALIVNAIDDAE